MMLLMVILLALLGANLFIAVLTFSYSQVLNRQDLAKKRLGDLARTQDGPTAILHMEGEVAFLWRALCISKGCAPTRASDFSSQA